MKARVRYIVIEDPGNKTRLVGWTRKEAEDRVAYLQSLGWTERTYRIEERPEGDINRHGLIPDPGK